MDEYSRFARLYDPIVGPFLRPIHRTVVAALDKRGCQNVADLCCGTGQLAGLAAKSGLSVTGVDLSPAMINIARRKHPDITFIEGDATRTGLPENAFDAATISFALHEKPTPVARNILTEAIRLTRPGGVIAVADYRLPTHGFSIPTGWPIAMVERLAGREHYSHFRRYMAAGGSASFLSRDGLSGTPLRTFLLGWAGVFFSPVK